MAYDADIAVYGSDGTLQLLVEVKARTGTSRTWAEQLLRNRYAHGTLPQVPYFLIATSDAFYLWCDVTAASLPRPPNFCIDPAPIFAPYTGRLNAPLSGGSLDLALTIWLGKLTRHPAARPLPEDMSELTASGLLKAVRGGRVEIQAPAVL